MGDEDLDVVEQTVVRVQNIDRVYPDVHLCHVLSGKRPNSEEEAKRREGVEGLIFRKSTTPPS